MLGCLADVSTLAPVSTWWFCALQALTLWLQYTMLLGNINISAPKPVISVFHAASFAFSAVTSGVLSTDCLLSGAPNPAILRVVIHLAVPVMVLLFLLIGQILW